MSLPANAGGKNSKRIGRQMQAAKQRKDRAVNAGGSEKTEEGDIVQWMISMSWGKVYGMRRKSA